LCDFLGVGFERVAHDEEIAAVECDRVPIDDIGAVALLEVRDSAGAAGGTGVGGRDVNRFGAADCRRLVRTLLRLAEALSLTCAGTQ